MLMILKEWDVLISIDRSTTMTETSSTILDYFFGLAIP